MGKINTLRIVENRIKRYDGEFKKKQLWEHLPKKMMYQTFLVAIDYLLYSRKISMDSQGTLGWIFYPEKIKEHLKQPHLFI